LFCQVTCVTPVLSAALPLSANAATLVMNVLDVGRRDERHCRRLRVARHRHARRRAVAGGICATTVKTLTPAWSGALATLHEVVPAARPLPPRLFVQVTLRDGLNRRWRCRTG
jgi:hypothetical protein